jgi:superfamily II DNA/RNA helicase
MTKRLRTIVVGLIHGDMAQYDRTQIINEFKKRDMPILIATDVAGMWFYSGRFDSSLVDIVSTWSGYTID